MLRTAGYFLFTRKSASTMRSVTLPVSCGQRSEFASLTARKLGSVAEFCLVGGGTEHPNSYLVGIQRLTDFYVHIAERGLRDTLPYASVHAS